MGARHGRPIYMGAPTWPPIPPTFGTPRRSRGVPLKRAASLSTARAWEHELLERGFLGPDGDGPAAQHLDHRGARVRVVARLVEDDGAAVLHEPGREMGLAER